MIYDKTPNRCSASVLSTEQFGCNNYHNRVRKQGYVQLIRGIRMKFLSYTKEYDPIINEMIDNDFVRNDIQECLYSFEQSATLVQLEDRIVGISVFSGTGSERSFTLYVDPNYRNRGIGTALLMETERKMKQSGVTKATCDFLLKEPEESFLVHRGYHFYLDSNRMSYTGPQKSIAPANITRYRDEDYLECQALVSKAFYEMRLLVGIPSDMTQPSEEDRKEYRDSSNDIYLLRVDHEIVAFLKLNDYEIETLAVRTDKQGKGYGRLLLSYGINTLLNKGATKISLWAVEGNPAKYLYQDMGFVTRRLHRVVKKDL